MSVEIKYNERSGNPITISKMEVIDELAYYLKRGEKVRHLYAEDASQINFIISKAKISPFDLSESFDKTLLYTVC